MREDKIDRAETSAYERSGTASFVAPMRKLRTRLDERERQSWATRHSQRRRARGLIRDATE